METIDHFLGAFNDDPVEQVPVMCEVGAGILPFEVHDIPGEALYPRVLFLQVKEEFR